MDIADFIAQNEKKELLRFSTAGSVDDGKSTLIGRLLYDSKLIYEDHLASLERDSVNTGSVEGGLDYALLLDGLKAEREQNITIDVAYRYFSTPKRKFIIADSPGHQQYTRNMATGASTTDLAVILIDASQGVLQQSKRHSFIMSLLNIKHFVVAINKMDLVDYDEEVYNRIKQDYIDFSARLSIPDIHFIPISALHGDNVVERSDRMPWYNYIPLLEYLETIHIASDRNLVDFRFPVQYVLRPNRNFRGYCGSIPSGTIRVGEEVMVLPSGMRSIIKSITTFDGDLEEAFPPMAVTLTLEDEIDVSRGDMIVRIHNLPHISPSFEAMIIWMNEKPLKANREYIFKHTTTTVRGRINDLRYKVDVNTLHREDAEKLELNEIGRASISLNCPIFFDIYSRNSATGGLIIIDPITYVTVGAVTIIDHSPNELIREHTDDGQPKSSDVHPHRSSVSLEERNARLNQQPVTIWFTGLPKSGKSSLAYALERRLFDDGYTAHVLDGENMRLTISRDLGFSADDRSENVRRAAGVAKLNNNLGLISIAAFVSPYKEDRDAIRNEIGERSFVEIYLSTSLETCEARDNDGLYTRARSGEIKNFTGVSAPYETPENPELNLSMDTMTVEQAVDAIVSYLKEKAYID